MLSFILGVGLTFLITSVNYRREHFKDIKQIFIESMKSALETGGVFWSSEFCDNTAIQLRGQITFIQHILPISVRHLNDAQQDSFRKQFGEFMGLCLSREDLHKEIFKKNPQTAANIQVLGAKIIAEYQEAFIDHATLYNLILAMVQSVWHAFHRNLKLLNKRFWRYFT
jgi:hypothetical protein